MVRAYEEDGHETLQERPIGSDMLLTTAAES